MSKRIVFFVCFFLIFSIYAKAGDNTIVVTATRNAAKVIKTPSKVNIITAEQLKDEGIVYVKDALKEIPGISVASNGAFGGTTSVYSRGLPSYYTKILIDGVDVSDPSLTQPKFDLSDLMVSDIKRIEIVQGAQSGLYGSNAIGSVINIITKSGKGKPYFKYSQKVGSFATYEETAQSGGSYGKFNYYVEGSRFDTNGISKMDKYNPKDHSYSRGDQDDSYHKTGFSNSIEYNFDDSFKIGEIFKWYKVRNYLDNGWYVTPAYHYLPDDAAKNNNSPSAKSLRGINNFLMTKLYLHKGFNNLQVRFNVFYLQNLRYNKSAPGWNDYKGKKWGSNVTAVYRIGHSVITAGLEQKMDKYEDNTPFKKLRYNYAGFMEAEQSLGNLNIQAAVREDDFKTFGKHFTYKAGANYLITKTDTILKANYSTGFRAPSIYELYAPPIPSWYFVGGNKNLGPEKAKTWDFGFLQRFNKNRVSFGAVYFKSIVRDRIEWYTNPDTWRSTYKNVKGKTAADGVELQASIKPVKCLTIGANYTYTKSINPDTKNQTARIPVYEVNGYITYKTLGDKLVSTLNGRYVGKRYDDNAHTYQTGKYAVFDFTSIYKLNKNLQASVSVKNIFDRFYEEVYGYSTLPRSVFATVSYKF